MKNYLLVLAGICSMFSSALHAQVTTLQEDFESYNGFGSSLSNGWTSGPSGFKVYIRNIAATNNKICETILTNNHRKDSLISPDLSLLTGTAVLNFQSRIVDSYLGTTASFSHIPATGDELKAFLSVDGSSFLQVEDLLSAYPVSSAGLAMTNFSIPISGNPGSVAKVKFIVSAKPNTEWYPSFDNFSLLHPSDPTAVEKIRKSDPGIILVPNPASQRLTILSPGFGQYAMAEIFNILGNPVFSCKMNGGKCIADVSNFRPGIYVVKVSEGSKTAFERLVVKQ